MAHPANRSMRNSRSVRSFANSILKAKGYGLTPTGAWTRHEERSWSCVALYFSPREKAVDVGFGRIGRRTFDSLFAAVDEADQYSAMHWMISAALEVPGFSDGSLPGRVSYTDDGFVDTLYELLEVAIAFLAASDDDLLPPPQGGSYFCVGPARTDVGGATTSGVNVE